MWSLKQRRLIIYRDDIVFLLALNLSYIIPLFIISFCLVVLLSLYVVCYLFIVITFHNIHLSHCVFYAITFDTNTLYIVQHVLGSKFEIQIINVWTLEFRHTINFKVYNMRSDRITNFSV